MTVAERSRNMRYKKPALLSMGYDAMTDELDSIAEKCDDIRWWEDTDTDTLLNALDGDEEDAWEFKMAFSELSAKCEQLRNAIYNTYIDRLHSRASVLVTLPKINIATETADLQKLVGGFLEVVPLADDAALLVDEDGLCKGLPVNASASMLAGRPIVGHAVVVGIAKNETGELYFTDCPKRLI